MKLRTDFVTNSSSSSYTVSIEVEGKDDDVGCDVFLGDDDGMVSYDLNCTAESILHAGSVEELIRLLRSAAEVSDDFYDPFDDDDDDDDDEDEPDSGAMERFAEELRDTFPSLEDIRKIKLVRNWCAWGEYASCFVWNLADVCPELLKLAEQVVNAEEGEKEAAQEALRAFLEDFPDSIENEGGDCFPSDFMGGVGKARLDYSGKDMETVARSLLDEKAAEDDRADETVEIDFTTGKITGDNVYYLFG